LRNYETTSVWVEDRNVTLLQSGVQVWWNQTADPGNYVLGVGPQSIRSYLASPDTVTGAVTAVHRFDSGAARGLGITFARGQVDIQVWSYVDATPANGGGEWAIGYLNYYCDAATQKTDVGEYIVIGANIAVTSNQRTASFALPIQQYPWRLSCAYFNVWDASTNGITGPYVQIQRSSSNGWAASENNYSSDINTGSAARLIADRVCNKVKRTPTDATPEIDLTVSRTWSVQQPNARNSVVVVAAWSFATYAINKQVTNSAGNTVDIDLIDAATDAFQASTSRVGDGPISLTVTTDVHNVYLVAYENNVRKARSANFTPGT
jgi:hypothetical protein